MNTALSINFDRLTRHRIRYNFRSEMLPIELSEPARECLRHRLRVLRKDRERDDD